MILKKMSITHVSDHYFVFLVSHHFTLLLLGVKVMQSFFDMNLNLNDTEKTF